MEQLVMEAYTKAKVKDFFSITIALEELLKEKLASADPRRAITTGQVISILKRNGLVFDMITA